MKKCMGAVILVLCIPVIISTTVYAAGKTVTANIKLKLDITRSDGIVITPGDKEQIYTSMAIKYAPDASPVPEVFDYKLNADEKNKAVDSMLKHNVVCQYALSAGGDSAFGEWTDLAGNVFVLTPGTVADGAYCLKFRKLDSYIFEEPEGPNMDRTIQSEPGGSTDTTVMAKDKPIEKASSSEFISYEDIEKAKKIAEKEPCHAVESDIYYVWLDSSAPAVELKADREFDKWTSSDIRCSVTVNDTGSKPDMLRVTYGGEQILEEKYDAGSYSGGGKEFVISAETLKGEGNELVVEAVDRAGNKGTVSRMVKIDKTAPSIEIRGAEDGGIYSGKVGLKICGEDIHPDTVSVAYKVLRITEGNEETAVSSAATLADINDKAVYCAEQDGNYRIECRAVDAAGNESPTVKRSFRVDTSAPSIGFGGIGAGEVLRNDGELKIDVSDNFADDCKVDLSGSVSSKNGSRDLKMAGYRLNGRNSSNTYYFKTDGEYSINVRAEDKAGNTAEENISFVIDKTSPVVDITGGYKSSDEMVLNSPPTFTFRITEENYETASVTCELKRTDADAPGTGETPEWTMSSAVSEFSLTVDKEGSYELNVRATDKAGNMGGKSLKFVLDTTKPEIDYVDDLNRKYLKSFSLPDNFVDYIKDSSSVDYRAYVNSENYDEGSRIEEDGKYVLKIIAVDDAGNQAEKTVEFIVDGTAPRVVIDGMADDGSVNKDDVLVMSLYDEEDYFTSVKLDGVELVTEDKQKTLELTIQDYGEHTIEIEASDMADNVMTQTIEAKCANSSPVEKGAATVRTLKQNERPGKNKGIRILLIALTVLILAGSVVVYCIYSTRLDKDKKRVSIKAQSIV